MEYPGAGKGTQATRVIGPLRHPPASRPATCSARRGGGDAGRSDMRARGLLRLGAAGSSPRCDRGRHRRGQDRGCRRQAGLHPRRCSPHGGARTEAARSECLSVRTWGSMRGDRSFQVDEGSSRRPHRQPTPARYAGARRSRTQGRQSRSVQDRPRGPSGRRTVRRSRPTTAEKGQLQTVDGMQPIRARDRRI